MRTGGRPRAVIVVSVLLTGACASPAPRMSAPLSPAGPTVAASASASPSPSAPPTEGASLAPVPSKPAKPRSSPRPPLAVGPLTVTSQTTATEVIAGATVATTGYGSAELVLTFLYPSAGSTTATQEKRFPIRGTGGTTMSVSFPVARAVVCAYATGAPGNRATVTAAVFLPDAAGPVELTTVDCA